MTDETAVIIGEAMAEGYCLGHYDATDSECRKCVLDSICMSKTRKAIRAAQAAKIQERHEGTTPA